MVDNGTLKLALGACVSGQLGDPPSLCYNSLTSVICSIKRLTHNTPCWMGQRIHKGHISKEEKR